MAHPARAVLESLLRERKLDVTLTSAAPWATAPEPCRAAMDVPALDAALGGGLRRGHVSELVGPRSSGRTTVLCRTMAAAVARGELTALVDLHDRFDSASAHAAGVDLSQLLWVREHGDLGRALKAMHLVLQAGGFGLVALDLADAAPRVVRQLPHTTWLRLARAIEGSQTVALLVAAERTARSAGGVTIAFDPTSGAWAGESDRSRRLRGVDLRPRVVGARA